MYSCLIEPHYLPSLAYFRLISDYDRIYIDVQSKFVKQTYRNRCKILLSNKVGQLVIPIKHNTLGGGLIDVKIDYSEHWKQVHWKSIKSAYGKTPFFEHYAPFFERIYFKEAESLVEFIIEQLELCFKFLGWNKEIVLVNSLEGLDKIPNLKNQVHSKQSKFDFTSGFYHQAFGTEFISNLSLIDLLFNIGPESAEFIKNTVLSTSAKR